MSRINRIFQKYPSSKIYAFEPNPLQRIECEQNIKDHKNISFFPLALSNYNGMSDFYITTGNIGASSLLNPRHIPFDLTQQKQIVKVPVTTLDSWCIINNIDFIDIMWMDVQGNELYVFEGSVNILKNTSIINTELGLVPYYENHTLKNDIIPFLEDLGFDLIYEKIEWECKSNAIFVNKNRLK